ncbi:sugar O-acetyltransferase [Rhizophagus clarus]|uniref:Sugar O-acetyltransferase n=1 Tax=Rhizophagus clarus TaxID=94130 RepID=A0A8H3QPI7_9GLOM|nr:sugar O-acetyltransferase [Rhizophagus clarus]
MLSEKEKSLAGLPYLKTVEELVNGRFKAREILYKINNSKPARFKTEKYLERENLFRQLFGSVGKDVEIEPPFYCDYGYNIGL